MISINSSRFAAVTSTILDVTALEAAHCAPYAQDDVHIWTRDGRILMEAVGHRIAIRTRAQADDPEPFEAVIHRTALAAARAAQPPHDEAVDITLNTDTEHERVTIAVGPTIITGDLHDPDVWKAAAAHRLERPTTTPATPTLDRSLIDRAPAAGDDLQQFLERRGDGALIRLGLENDHDLVMTHTSYPPPLDSSGHGLSVTGG